MSDKPSPVHASPPSQGATLADFLAYRGARGEQLGPDNTDISRIGDGVFLLVIASMLVRNTVFDPNPFAFLLATIIASHVALLIFRPAPLNIWRGGILGVLGLMIAMWIPIRVDANVLVASFIACSSCLALFFVGGTKIALAACTVYLGYVAVMLQSPQYGFSEPWLNVIFVVGLAAVIFVVCLMLHHFMVRLEVSLRESHEIASTLQQALDSLQFSAVAGGVGLWEFDYASGLWTGNEVFRDLLDLPHDQFPELTSEVIGTRIPADAWEGIRARGQGQEDQDFELLEVMKADGSRMTCQGMSKHYVRPDGRQVRYGMLIAFNDAP